MEALLRIVGMAWRHKWRLNLAYLSFFGSVGGSIVVVWIIGQAIDKLVVKGEHDEILSLGTVGLGTLFVMAGAMLGVSLVRGLFDGGRTYLTDSLAQKVSYDLRNNLYDKLQHLSFAFHDKKHTGSLMSNATADVEAVRRFVMMGLVRSAEVGVRLIGIGVWLVFISWELTLIAMAFAPVVVFRSAMMGKKGRDYWLATQHMMDESIGVLQENLAGIHVVKAFASEEYESKKYAEKVARLRDQHYKSERLQGTESSWMTLYFSVVLVGLFWYGGLEVIEGNISAGEFAMFLLLINQINQPIRMLPFMINSFARAATSGKRLFEVLDANSPVEEAPNARDIGRTEGQVRFSNVSFSYDNAEPALKNVEFSIPPGSVVALLGAPGSGKSTVVNLLPRFYDPTEGQITIDDLDIRDFTLASLRRNVGIVQQDVFLFGARIRDNVAYGADEATFEDIVKVAKAAQLHDHIMSLPDGYDTWVGERGVTLSGGQRQRLSIARTILIDPPVLILDDSTSSVDVETERMIHRAMKEVMLGRTTFVIAHRLSTVREADIILVLKEGEIVERGTHEELIGRGGIYQDIYELQLKPQEEIMMDVTLVGDEGERARQREDVTIDASLIVTEGGNS